MLTAKVQYAIVLLDEINKKSSESKAVRLKDIADKHSINIDLLEQVARRLRIAGIISSVRGPGGGYLAVLDFSTLLLPQLMRAIDPDKALKLAVHSEEGKALILRVYTKMLEQLEF